MSIRVTRGGETFCELVAERAHVHLERMADDWLCLIVSEEGGGYWHASIHVAGVEGDEIRVTERETDGRIERSEQ